MAGIGRTPRGILHNSNYIILCQYYNHITKSARASDSFLICVQRRHWEPQAQRRRISGKKRRCITGVAVGVDVAVQVAVGVAVRVAVTVAVAVRVGVAVAVAVAVAVGVRVAVAVGVGVGVAVGVRVQVAVAVGVGVDVGLAPHTRPLLRQ